MKLEQLIKDNKINEALDLVKKSSDMSPALKNYNEAFIHFKNQDLINARYFLEKAQKMGLYSKEMTDALTVVKRELGIESIENSYYKEDTFMLNAVGFHQDVYYSLIGILLLSSLIYFSKAKKMMGLVSLIFCFALGGFHYIIADHQIRINEVEASVIYVFYY